MNYDYVPKAPQGAVKRVFRCTACERAYTEFVLAKHCACSNKVEQLKECPECKSFWPLEKKTCCVDLP
jgi:hypothetical protein